jgi:hypothetical protein
MLGSARPVVQKVATGSKPARSPSVNERRRVECPPALPPPLRYVDNLENFVAVVIDHLHRNLSAFWWIERTADR